MSVGNYFVVFRSRYCFNSSEFSISIYKFLIH